MTAMAGARRLRHAGATLGGYLGLAIIIAVVVALVALGVLPERRWAPFGDIRVWQFLGQGLLVTLQIGAVSLVASLILSVPLALGRINLPGPLRWIVVAWIELVRATPVLALILFTTLFMPRTGIDIAPIWAATLALTIYTSAVLAEIVRAGIVSIPGGEVAAARSLGLSYLQTMRLVVLPQALRRMMPAIVSQCITLVKDTSLASIAAVSELVGYARSSFVFFGNAAETLFVVACIFFVINYTLSRIARRLELRRPAEERVAVPVAEEQQVTRPTL
jgi:His/Glu/Gln/Arg/opine family amino acid ABC transporter permease subunit